MLEEIETPEKAASFLDDAIKNKTKIMGFGHREYKVKDPRAIILQKLLSQFNLVVLCLDLGHWQITK